MNQPVFRHPDKVQVLPWRDWIRANLPAAKQGFVAQDLDLVVLRFGPLVGRDYKADGEFLLAEIKCNGAAMGYSQERLFALMDRLLRQGDPTGCHYRGFYVIGWRDDHVAVNGNRLTMGQFRDFLLGKLRIAPMFGA